MPPNSPKSGSRGPSCTSSCPSVPRPQGRRKALPTPQKAFPLPLWEIERSETHRVERSETHRVERSEIRRRDKGKGELQISLSPCGRLNVVKPIGLNVVKPIGLNVVKPIGLSGAKSVGGIKGEGDSGSSHPRAITKNQNPVSPGFWFSLSTDCFVSYGSSQ
jgi:hypothetical protein